MKVYDEIIDKSVPIDQKFEKMKDSEIDSVEIVFQVPNFHPRIKQVSSYSFSSLSLEKITKNEIYNLTPNHIFIIDEYISKQNFILSFLQKNEKNP